MCLEKVLEILKLPLRSADDDRTWHHLRLSNEAYAEYLSFHGRLEPELGGEGDLSLISDWGSKSAQGGVVRIAGLLHMAKHAGHQAPWDLPISPETFSAATRIMNYLIFHALAAFKAGGADSGIEDAKVFLSRIRRKGWESLTRRDLFETVKGAARFSRSGDLSPGLEVLVDHGYLHAPIGGEPRRRRRPSEVYLVNPLKPTQNPQKESAVSISADIANDSEAIATNGPPLRHLRGPRVHAGR